MISSAGRCREATGRLPPSRTSRDWPGSLRLARPSFSSVWHANTRVRWQLTRPAFSGRREIAIGLGLYAVYLSVRRAVYDEQGRNKAAQNAERVVALERRLRIDVEPAVQRALVRRRRLIGALNAGYVTLNVVVTLGALARLHARRHPEYHRMRSAAVLVTLAAQPAFLLFPTAPPRKLPGFIDTVRELSGIDLDGSVISMLYDPIAAMPSIHLSYAVVSAGLIRETASSPVTKVLACAYPPAVFATVVATANHYVLDALAGSALGLTSLKVSRHL